MQKMLYETCFDSHGEQLRSLSSRRKDMECVLNGSHIEFPYRLMYAQLLSILIPEKTSLYKTHTCATLIFKKKMILWLENL